MKRTDFVIVGVTLVLLTALWLKVYRNRDEQMDGWHGVYDHGE